MAHIYKEYIIAGEPFNAEILSSILWELNIDGISEEVNCIKVYAQDNEVNIDSIENQLSILKANNLIRNFMVQENFVASRNWNEEWEKGRGVINVTDRIIIKPSFKDYTPRINELVITLDPKMSFGTGDHQTTKICIILLEKYLKPGVKVLDAGSGTAILSIAAAKLGADHVTAFDIDDWSYENGAENVKLNNVSDIVNVRKCELYEIEENDFDIIIANIQRNILSELASGFNLRLKKNGLLILSGLLEDEKEIILDVYLNLGFREKSFIKIDEWIGIVLERQA